MKTLAFPGSVDFGLLAALFDPLDDCPFFVKDRELRYVAANRAMARLCSARDPAALIGRSAADFFPADAARRFEAFDRAILASGRPLWLDLTLAPSRGGPAWLMFTRQPVRDTDGGVVGVAAASRRLGSSPADARLARVAEAMKAELAGPLDLARLAAIAGTSASQLERDWKRRFGVTPGGFRHRLRLARAFDLLAGPLAVSEVAQACGFSDQSAFSRRFLAGTGLTPGAYRRALPGRGGHFARCEG